ncbi:MULTISPECIES: hypothetical protein [Aliivibrio]|jgi:hypothetical protein|uniref:Transglycosylase SLT domain-containing protein n=3 Tax=Aliivibrio TaxID=511678 RepID=A0A1B9P2E3_ALILO|nr:MULTISPECIES: hypothetical protein [Aliivibrio]MBB1314766.1 hypothetical protein [Aliivibrio sp. SR45-2]OCH22540.1 hypothetical protein A6E04_06430 [Aliivibrio logei]OEF11552.1 hypothetical protein A1Q5_10680 [Aliivibrio logei 5S-186]CAQ78329.1 putative lipoprotein [Aliivibrio salmonicida LFI1238]
MNYKFSLIIVALVSLSGCATAPPTKQDNLCEIFREKGGWYDDAKDMNEEYGTPINVAMAIMKQESSFRSDVRPPRTKLLGFIPWSRPSSAYGYAQAQDPVWGEYEDETGGGSRSSFDDAIMFIGWYTDGSQKQLGISKWDPYNQYLAYHEGRGGYKRKSYQKKPQLIKIARRVESQAKTYGWQLKQCKVELERQSSWWW